jgi:general secretion pathway protein G
MRTTANKINIKKSFSLLELIFVISVLGIIAAVAVPKLMDTRHDAMASTITQDISTITTAVQSYYMVNNGIDKLSDTVNINPNVWTIGDKKLEYKVDDIVCITMELVQPNKLSITIQQSSSDVCQKIYDKGIRDISYTLY